MASLAIGFEVEANFNPPGFSDEPDLVMNSSIAKIYLQHAIVQPRTRAFEPSGKARHKLISHAGEKFLCLQSEPRWRCPGAIPGVPVDHS
jgi:hypothetical protein